MVASKFDRVGLIGVGLIGGSLSLAAKDAGIFGRVTGCGRSLTNLKTAKKRGIVDDYTTDPARAVRDADLIILASPVASYEDIVKALRPSIKDGAIVTDVGSVKGAVVRSMEKLLGKRAHFIGAHPIAGSEKSGAAFADKNLFKGCKCIVTPTLETNRAALGKIKRMWKKVGARVFEMSPERHDIILAATSHLPHVAAFSLVEAVQRLQKSEPNILDFTGGSFKDFTRVAESSPEMWRDIFLQNSDAVLQMLARFEDVADELKTMIKRKDKKGIVNMLERSRKIKMADKA